MKLKLLVILLFLLNNIGAQTVYQIIENSPVHTKLEAAINAAGLNATLDGDGPFTVFAPSDDAFAALPAGTIEALLADPQGLLTDILLYHVVGATALSTDLSDGQQIVTLNGASVTVTINANGVFINDAQVTVADLVADNGVVHVINAVLLPPAPPGNTVMDIIENSPAHTTLEAAINAAGLNATLDGDGLFTVFAPSDDAFAALPAGTIEALLADPQGLLTDILLYHVVGATALSTDLSDGQQIVTLNGASVTVTINANGVFINDAQVTVADLVADNGVVHVINAVLLPPAPPANTVMDIIENSPAHTTLEAAINAAGLNATLDGEGPFTVFAPSDDAFVALPAGTIEALLADPQGLLTDILLYHVVGSTALSTDLSDGQQIVTLNGASVTVTINANGVFINDAQVTVADLVADNGVVHVINAVLLPPAPPANTVMDIIENSPAHTTLEAAINAAGLNATLDGDGPFTVFAPSDDAFAALPAGTIEALLADPQGLLTDILLYHVVGATALSTDLSDGQQIVTLNGASVTVTINANGVFINDAQVTVADLVADNGVVHVINAVLLPPAPPANTVMDIIENSPAHTTLEAAINAAGLNATLDGDGSFTVFAPSDDAFAALPAGTIEALLADPQGLLTDILLYHVVSATALSTDLSDGQQIVTLNGASVTVTINANGVFINDAQVTVADLVADNGVVHVINAVLLPPAPVTTVMDIIENSPAHTTLEAAINAAGLNATLDGDGPFTVFAPSDDAFAALPAGTIEALLADPQGLLTDILLYHVVGATALSTDLSDGQQIVTLNGASVTVTINANGVFINDAQVTVADLVADNGVVHVINAVLLPPAPPANTVMDIIENSPAHTTLEAAINAAGLNATLDGDGPFTVFAPSDDAFAALPAGTIEALLADPQGLLTDILLYHVVGATALSTDLSDGQQIVTLNGASVTVTINANGVFINDAQVTVADLVADNGVVHVINAVLLPPAPPVSTVMDIIANDDQLTILETAVVAAGLDGALNGDGPFTVFAPRDAAFAALPEGTLEALLADPQGLLTDILLYHVVGAEALSTDLSDGQVITTLNGETVTVTINAEGIFINDAKVLIADLVADNGVVHIIKTVLLPPAPPVPTTVMDIIANSADHTILETAILAADLDGALNGDGPFTVFAPNDDAFAALPAGTIEALLADPQGLLTEILLYHVVGAQALSTDLSNGQAIATLNGENVTVTINANGIFINDIKVIIADLIADNGVVHVIKKVLLPPAPPVPTTVMDIIAERSDLTILETAIVAAGLDGTLSGDGPFTVFAPKDGAFEALPAGTIEALLADPQGLLTDILLYHTVGATALSTDLSNGQTITTLQGEDVTVTINADGVFINNAKVKIVDLVADNGVVHVINTILLPPSVGTENVETNSSKFQVYPNPGTDFIYIQNTDNVQVDKMILFDGLGRSVKEWTSSDTYEQLDVTSCSSGLYNLVIYSEAVVLTYPLVIQRN